MTGRLDRVKARTATAALEAGQSATPALNLADRAYAPLRKGRVSGREGAEMRGSLSLAERVSGKARTNEPVPLKALGPVSTILQELRDTAPPDKFSLDWLLDSLQTRSFAVVILMLALVAMAPGISIVAGLLMMIPAAQMIAGRSTPAFPRRVGAYTLPTSYLSASVRRVIPILGHIEQIIRPRWPMPPETTKRTVGVVVALLAFAVVFCPIPLSNVAPAFVIVLIAIAYLEEDGLFLSFALAVGIVLLAIACVVIWEAILGAQRLGGLF